MLNPISQISALPVSLSNVALQIRANMKPRLMSHESFSFVLSAGLADALFKIHLL